MIESGLDPTDERVVSLQSKLSSLVGVAGETTEVIEENTEAVAENTSGYNDAQKAFDEWVKNRNEKIRDTFQSRKLKLEQMLMNY